MKKKKRNDSNNKHRNAVFLLKVLNNDKKETINGVCFFFFFPFLLLLSMRLTYFSNEDGRKVNIKYLYNTYALNVTTNLIKSKGKRLYPVKGINNLVTYDSIIERIECIKKKAFKYKQYKKRNYKKFSKPLSI